MRPGAVLEEIEESQLRADAALVGEVAFHLGGQPELQRRLRALAMAGRAASADVGTASAGRFRGRQRALHEALHGDDGSILALERIARATVALLRAVADHPTLARAAGAQAKALGDAILAHLADREGLRVLTQDGEIRDVRAPIQAPPALQRATELTRTILTESALAWAKRDDSSRLHWMDALVRRALAEPELETVLPVPFEYVDESDNRFLLPAGSRIGGHAGRVVAKSDGMLIRTANGLVLADEGVLHLECERAPRLFERLRVADEFADVFVDGIQRSGDRDAPAAVLGARRARVDVTGDEGDTRIELDDARILQTHPLALAIEGDRLLYASDGLIFGADTGREIGLAQGGSQFARTLEELALVSASESLHIESATLRTVEGADGERETVFELTTTRLQTADDALSLDSAELCFLDHLDGRSRYCLRTAGLTGRLAGFDVDAQGVSTLFVMVAADGEPASIVLANPSTVSFSRDERTLAVTDGRVRALYEGEGALVVNLDALKTSLRDGDELFSVELGRVTLDQGVDGSGRLQVTGKLLDGRVGGVHLSGGDLGVEVNLGEGGSAEEIFVTGRSVTVGDGISDLIAHEASLRIGLDPRQRLSSVDHETGLTELCSSDMGTMTLRGASALELDYQGRRLAMIRADTEDLAWTQPDGSQLDLRGALATLELDEEAAPARATLETGALAWRGTDGVEVTSFGLGGQVEFSPDGGMLQATAGAQGMTIRTNGGIAQIEGGTLVARYAEDGSFEHAVVEAQRTEYFSSASGTFTVERGTLAIRSMEDGGTETVFDASELRHQHGGDFMRLVSGRLVLAQDTEGHSVLDGEFSEATLGTSNSEFDLSPAAELHVEIDAEAGFTRLAGDVRKAHHRSDSDDLLIHEARFDGAFVDGTLSAFDAEGTVHYERRSGITLDAERARVSLSPLEDGGSELLVSGEDLKIRVEGHRFASDGKAEVGFLMDEAGKVELVRASTKRFAVTDGPRRYAFDDAELGIAHDGNVHLIDGRMHIFLGAEEVGELRGSDALLDFEYDGMLARVQLLSSGAYLTGEFGTIRATENRATAWFSEKRLSCVVVSGGAVSLELENGLDLDLENSRASLVYDDQGNPTLTVEDGRALLESEFGRLTLPAGFELTARQDRERTLLAGATPNAVLERHADVLAVNDFTMTMEIGSEGFEHLTARGSAHFEHPDRRVRLSGGALDISYDKSTDRMVYAGDLGAFRMVNGELSMIPNGKSSRIELGASLCGALTGTRFELAMKGHRLESLRFEDATAELEVNDASNDEVSSVRFAHQTFSALREHDGSTRLSLKPPDDKDPRTLIGIGDRELEFMGASAISLHLTDDGRLAEADGFVVSLPGTARIENRSSGIAATSVGVDVDTKPSRVHVALDGGVVLSIDRGVGLH